MAKKFSKSKTKTRKDRPVPQGVGSKSDREEEEVINTAQRNLHRSQCNDPAWYSKDPQLILDVGRIPFAYSAGQPIQIRGLTQKMPGVMGIHFVPTVGFADDLSAPINVASTSYFTRLREKNSGFSQGDPADFTMMMVALDSLYMLHAFMRRAYGIARTYTPTNLYYPKGVLRAMGLDPENILANLAQFRASINLFARSLSAFHLPTAFTFIMRHQWMCNDLFVDSTSSKAQTYLYVPDGLWMYDNTYTTGTKLSMATMSNPDGSLLKWTDLDKMWQNVYGAIQNDEDIRAMSGIIAMAFPDNILIAPEIPDDYTVVPSYDERVLMQIHNSTAFGTAVMTEEDYTITQNPAINNGCIMTKYSHMMPLGTPIQSIGVEQNAIINYYKDDITTDDVMEATRLMGYAQSSAATEVGIPIEIRICGSEVVTYYQVIRWQTGSVPHSFEVVNQFSNCLIANYGEGNDVHYKMDIWSQFSSFDWAPILYIYSASAVGTNYAIGLSADIDVYATINATMLSQMHRVALLSEFDYR